MNTKSALTYGPAFVGAGVWAFARFPDQLAWAAGAYGKAFGAISAFYEDWTRVEGYGEALHEALKELRNPPATALDLATGTGYVARTIARRYPTAQVTGVDITPEMLGIAQHQSVAEGLEVTFSEADSSDLPFEDDSFDLVVIQNSLVYPEEMVRVTAPGGRAIVVFSFAGPWVKLAWPALADRFTNGGADQTWGHRAGAGYYGVAWCSK